MAAKEAFAQEAFAQDLGQWLARPLTGSALQAVNESNALAGACGRSHAESEDCALIAAFPGGYSLALVADGIGGLADGAACAATAAAVFVARIENDLRAGSPDPTAAMAAANETVWQRWRGAGGATCTALVHGADGQGEVVHLGDTRAYALAENRPPAVVTRDHTELAALGERANVLPAARRARLGANLLHAVGLAPLAAPDKAAVSGEAFLLTSDGIHDFAGRAIESLRAGVDPSWALTQLLRVATEAGSHDDLSALWFTPAGLPAMESVTVWTPAEQHGVWCYHPDNGQSAP